MARSLYNITTLSYTVLTTLLYKCHKNLSYEYLNCILPGHQWHVLRKRYFLVHKKSRFRGFSFKQSTYFLVLHLQQLSLFHSLVD